MRRRAAAVLLLLAALPACSDDDGDTASSTGPTEERSTSSAAAPSTSSETAPEPDPDLDAALSEPDADSVYPERGELGVDALHYDLDLSWDPATDTLTGAETLTFRSTVDADEVRLDLGEPLEVSAVRVDGDEVEFTHDDDKLVVETPVGTDERHAVEIAYRGTPEPVEAPTQRGDFDDLGFTIDEKHQAWTMQEPFGALTWYAVNDHPSDKALYDFTLTTTDPMVGVANGVLVADESADGERRTEFHLAEPAASYLTTVAFGDYRKTEDQGPRGLPITYWTFADADVPDSLRGSPAAIAWLEERLGPYPFDTAGVLVVDSESGMETQTLVTLGDTEGALSPGTVLHEYAHQWYGDQVTPDDWRDVWMNEGMAMYLQLLWQAEQDGVDEDTYLDSVAGREAEYRAEAGPPADYDPGYFAASNVYYSPALMWHELRKRIGDDDRFWSIMAGWPTSQDNRSSNRDAFLDYLEDATGQDLDDFWDAWLLGERTPPRS